MKAKLLATCAAVTICVVAVTTSQAQSNDEALRRLEAKIDALAKENGSLKSRLSKVEAAPRAARSKQEPGYVGPIGKPSGDPTPEQIAAARAAHAADMSVVTKYAPPPRPACAQFGGWYVGGNVGWAYYDHEFYDRNGLGDAIDTGLQPSVNTRDDGFVGGVQGGYNWQIGCTLLGVEADWSWSNLKASTFTTDGDGGSQDTLNVESRLRWFGTARVRSGIIVDNVLLYVAGGLAFADFDRTFNYFQDGPATNGIFTSSKTKLGWTAGVGTEWAFAPNWTLKSEFLYMRFEQDELTVVGNGPIGNAGVSYQLDSLDSAWVTRIGLNYRFGDYGKAPVQAKY